MSLYEWFTTTGVDVLGRTLLHSFWQLGLLWLIAAVWMACEVRAATRYAVGVGVLTMMLLVPVVSFLLIASSAGHPVHIWPGHTGFPGIPHGTEIRRWIVYVWGAGVAVLTLRALVGIAVVSRVSRQPLRRAGAPLEAVCRDLRQRLGIATHVRLRVSESTIVPMVAGWVRPILVIPVAALTGLTPTQLRLVLAHELAHIRRLDPWLNMFQVVCESILFYHPAVWWLSRTIREERELCCDDLAVRVCGEPLEYVRALVLLEELRQAPELAVAVRRGGVGFRVRRILSPESGGHRGLALVLTLLLGLVGGIGVAAWVAYEPPLHPAVLTEQPTSPGAAGELQPKQERRKARPATPGQPRALKTLRTEREA